MCVIYDDVPDNNAFLFCALFRCAQTRSPNELSVRPSLLIINNNGGILLRIGSAKLFPVVAFGPTILIWANSVVFRLKLSANPS